MNRLAQPSFYYARATRIGATLAAAAVVVAAAAFDPATSAPLLARLAVLIGRMAVDALSIVLAAAPFACAGALCAALLQRVTRGRAAAAAVGALFAPGCDCSMNGFAPALRHCSAPLAGAALVWGAACNPVALVATAMVLGRHVLYARAAGGFAAACLVALAWCFVREREPRPQRADECRRGDLCASAERAVLSLVPAALIAAAVVTAFPALVRATASPWSAGLAGALLSPCSSADPMLARIFARAPAAQAAFVIAGQCLDLRQSLLVARTFGARRALLAWLCGTIGCIVAAAAA